MREEQLEICNWIHPFIDVGALDRNNEDESEGTDFAQRVLDSADVTKRARLGTYESNYRCLLHIEAQSNVVERLFIVVQS